MSKPRQRMRKRASPKAPLNKLWFTALACACIFYFAATITVLLQARDSNFSTRGVTVDRAGPWLVGGQEIHYAFPDSVRHIDDLVLFMDAASYRANEKARLSIGLKGSNVEKREVVLGTPSRDYRIRYGNMVGLVFDSVNVTKAPNQNISLTLFTPEGTTGPRIRFYTTERFMDEDELIVEGSVVSDRHLMVQTHYLDRPKLTTLAIVGGILFLIVCVVSFQHRFHVGFSSIVILALALTLSEFYWQQRLEGFYGWFWPDRYVDYARTLRQWFTGDLAWEDLIDYTARYRNAHAWVVPASIATLSLSGLSYVLSYSILNMLAYAGLVATWTLLFIKAFPQVRQFDRVLFMAAIALHYLHLFVGLSLLTDVLTCYFVGLFFLLFYPIINNTRNMISPFGGGAVVWAGLALFLSLQTRIAMLPLVIAPLALLAWVFVRDRFLRNEIEYQRLAAIAATVGVAVLLTLTVYKIFGLFDSIGMAKKMVNSFSANNFIFDRFVINLGNLLILACVALLVARYTTFTDNMYSLIWIFIIGYLCMLYLGEVPTWPRYLAPLAAPAVFYTLSVMMDKSDRERPMLYRAAATVLIGYHIFVFF